jgi:hypothetical protein
MTLLIATLTSRIGVITMQALDVSLRIRTTRFEHVSWFGGIGQWCRSSRLIRE